MLEDWLEHYRVLMFGAEHTYTTVTEGLKLKYDHLPDKLFKYRVLNDHTWDALSNDTLFVRKTSVQNDTREANIILTPDAETSIRQQLYDDLTRRYGFPRTMVKNADDVVLAINDYFKDTVCSRVESFLCTDMTRTDEGELVWVHTEEDNYKDKEERRMLAMDQMHDLRNDHNV